MTPTHQGSIRLFRLAGITLYLHWSWFLVAYYEIKHRAGLYTSVTWNALEYIDGIVEMAGKYGLHVSLNMHRAPGYCVNAGFNEPFNLWKDTEALDAFCFQWGMWAKRYKDMPPSKISFDLVNEPSMREDMNDQHSAHR